MSGGKLTMTEQHVSPTPGLLERVVITPDRKGLIGFDGPGGTRYFTIDG